jgi:hypothetical protein
MANRGACPPVVATRARMTGYERGKAFWIEARILQFDGKTLSA